MVTVLHGKQLKDMILGAATVLEQNKDALDALNVFPVPDGDTGTNMSLTMISAAKEAAGIGDDNADIKSIMSAVSLGALKGARGNSGVILSQIFAGFADAISGAEGGLNVELVALAFRRGVEFAYKAVMKPKEGTILTVAASVADAAELMATKTDDIHKQIVYMLQEGEKTLKETPEMLPVLKEAGVVDAGGAGYMVILMAFKAVMDGDEIDSGDLLKSEGVVDFTNLPVSNGDIEFGYCTEFFIKNLYPTVQNRDIDMYRNNLGKIGDCVLVVGDLELVKTHVHTNEPGLALQYAQILGELSHVKIDNMREQHRELSDDFEIVSPVKDMKNLAVIAISCGDGIRSVFADWQIDGFVEGGQSMNPSTDDILKAIEAANSNNVIVLPNNKNIILAAEQAADMSGKNVVVIKTKSIPQGIAAAVAYDPDADMEENAGKMKKAASAVKTGMITNAVRNTKVNGTKIKEGELIGLAESKIVSNGEDMGIVLCELLDSMINDQSELITVYYGCDVSEQDAQKVLALIEGRYKQFDTELMPGGQPVYQYMISVE